MGRGAFPQYSLGERVADGTIHVISVAASVAALTALLIISIQTNTAPMVAGFAIYGVALVATFYYSAGYRLIGWPRLKEVFRRLDHTVIFLMIAATYTPFVLIKMDNAWGHGLLAVVWIIAAIGIAIKSCSSRASSTGCRRRSIWFRDGWCWPPGGRCSLR